MPYEYRAMTVAKRSVPETLVQHEGERGDRESGDESSNPGENLARGRQKIRRHTTRKETTGSRKASSRQQTSHPTVKKNTGSRQASTGETSSRTSLRRRSTQTGLTVKRVPMWFFYDCCEGCMKRKAPCIMTYTMDGTINICEKCRENNQECEAWEDQSAIVDCNGQFIFDKGTWDQHTVPNPNGGPDQGKHADRSTASSEPSSTPPTHEPSVEQVSGALVTLNMNQPPTPTKLQELEERLRVAEMEWEALISKLSFLFQAFSSPSVLSSLYSPLQSPTALFSLFSPSVFQCFSNNP
ncbi:hypothetical protein HYDPIDRAFT_32102 [Hydnomerulius pinastri MD-312]|uniref:Uncharacterized protein n=1 Tax=Hydnomerulius pinastri MD-312 TaxID=994086 RepID=A0A0C9WAU2_9AGAM|nr:hypothetical protein HYDPIDRAFT_32102 [Hydnomerulius pinastri MD-312]